MLIITENHQGPFCANCQCYRAHYFCRQGRFYPLYYGHCILHQRSRKRQEGNVCPQWTPSNGAYNRPAEPCAYVTKCPFSQTKA